MPIKPDKTTAVASQKVLKQAGLTLAQMDVIELNKAFAAKALALMRKLDFKK